MILPGFLLRFDPRLRREYFSLNNLDARLEKYLDFDNGFFIETGANDGVAQSNTLHFERYRGWRGLLIEPVPPLAQFARAVRPGALTANCALGTFEQRGTSVDMTYCNLMSVVDGAMTATEQQQHLADGAAVQKLKTYRLSAPCIPLSDLIDRYGIGRIDLFSLDVEGYEANVLKGLDFARHRPRYMLIEARYRGDVEAAIASYYKVEAELTDRDVLYAAKDVLDLPYSVSPSFLKTRTLTNLGALARLHRR